MAPAYVLCSAMKTCHELRGKKIKQDVCALVSNILGKQYICAARTGQKRKSTIKN